MSVSLISVDCYNKVRYLTLSRKSLISTISSVSCIYFFVFYVVRKADKTNMTKLNCQQLITFPEIIIEPATVTIQTILDNNFDSYHYSNCQVHFKQTFHIFHVDKTELPNSLDKYY